MPDKPSVELNVVTGTFNRLEALVGMVKSVRQNMPDRFSYLITIVDGGSTDGTIQWCKTQKDIHLIEQGELLGAIRAFDAGAEAVQANYTIMAQDEIVFHPHSIIRAWVHLETHPDCGAVAFMDDRLSKPGDQIKYKAQMQVAVAPNGQGTKVIYAQVGMFRHWLGKAAGWWGSHDEIMNQAKTYGGDNYLSSRIWEMGYTIEIVDGVAVDELMVNDSLRQINNDYHDSAFYKRFPLGPHISMTTTVENPQTERLRVLYAPIYEKLFADIHRANKRGLRESLEKRGVVFECDWVNKRYDFPAIVATFKPHLMLTQFHGGRDMPVAILDKCREACPGMLMVNWNGDARELTEPDYLEFLKHFDMQLVVNASALAAYEAADIRAAYWQIGYEKSLYDPLPVVPKHDILFLGNCYNDSRRALEETLLSTGFDVGLYGSGWKDPAGYCLYDFGVGEALYKGAKIAVGDTFFDGKTPVEAFVSNRVFQALAAGAFLIQEQAVNLEAYTGLVAGVHYVEYRNFGDLKEQIAQWIGNPVGRHKIAEAGQAYVLENYSFDMQVKKLFRDILPMMEEQRVTA